METSYAALHDAYCGRAIELDGLALHFEEETLLRGLAKYGRAIAHTLEITNALRAASAAAFDLEMSVDETDAPRCV